jgi:hypothetical protein
MTDCCGIVGIKSEPQKTSTLKKLLEKMRLIFQTTENKDGLKHVNNIQKNSILIMILINLPLLLQKQKTNKTNKSSLAAFFKETNSPFNLLKLDDSQRQIL